MFKVELFYLYFTQVVLVVEKVKFFLNRSFSVQCSSLEVRNVSDGTVISSCHCWVCEGNRARRCTACLVATVVELILSRGGGMFVNDRTSGAFSIWGPQDS